MTKMLNAAILVVTLLTSASCSTVPIDPSATSHVMEVTIPTTAIDTDTGEVVPFDEEVIRVDMVEEAETEPDVWTVTGRAWSTEVDEPAGGQAVPFETSPQEWPRNTPLRWRGRVIDGWRHPETEEFLLVINRTEAEYPMSDASWDYQIKTTKVGVTEKPEKTAAQ